MSKYGVDVSEHNGAIDWKKAKNNIEFCFIRGGYGKNNIDKRFFANAKGCIQNDIPFGIYWFSYALSVDDAKREADFVSNLADDYSPKLGLCFDWEYDSDKRAKEKGVTITNAKRKEFAVAFLERVKERGYRPILYSNLDYIHNKGFVELINQYDLWLAQPSANKPSLKCLYWQCSFQGAVSGINTNVDIDVSFDSNVGATKDFSTILEKTKEKYLAVAYEIIAGKYGVGNARKNKLKEEGYDYSLAQSFVNKILE